MTLNQPLEKGITYFVHRHGVCHLDKKAAGRPAGGFPFQLINVHSKMLSTAMTTADREI